MPPGPRLGWTRLRVDGTCPGHRCTAIHVDQTVAERLRTASASCAGGQRLERTLHVRQTRRLQGCR
jgi:hypothetical protein